MKHNIRFLADIRYTELLRLIWLITDTFLPTPSCRDNLISPVVELKHSIILHLLCHIGLAIKKKNLVQNKRSTSTCIICIMSNLFMTTKQKDVCILSYLNQVSSDCYTDRRLPVYRVRLTMVHDCRSGILGFPVHARWRAHARGHLRWYATHVGTHARTIWPWAHLPWTHTPRRHTAIRAPSSLPWHGIHRVAHAWATRVISARHATIAWLPRVACRKVNNLSNGVQGRQRII